MNELILAGLLVIGVMASLINAAASYRNGVRDACGWLQDPDCPGYQNAGMVIKSEELQPKGAPGHRSDDELVTNSIETRTGQWKVQARGGRVQIVDDMGRQRMVANGLENLASLTASVLSEQPFSSSESADDVLKSLAKRF